MMKKKYPKKCRYCHHEWLAYTKHPKECPHCGRKIK